MSNEPNKNGIDASNYLNNFIPQKENYKEQKGILLIQNPNEIEDTDRKDNKNDIRHIRERNDSVITANRSSNFDNTPFNRNVKMQEVKGMTNFLNMIGKYNDEELSKNETKEKQMSNGKQNDYENNNMITLVSNNNENNYSNSYLNRLLPLNNDINNKKGNLKVKGPKGVKNNLINFTNISKKEFTKYNEYNSKINDEVRELLKSEGTTTKNIKSLTNEKKINESIVAVMSFLSIILCFFQLYEVIDSNYEMTSIILTIRSLILILSIPNLIFIYRRFNINIDIRKYNLKLRESNLWSSGYYKVFFIEILLNIIQPFPYLEFTFKYNQGKEFKVKLSFSHICTILMVIRIYLTIKLLNYYTIWTNARSKRIGKLQGIEVDSNFAIKVILKQTPVTFIIIICFFFILIFSFLLRGFEYFDIDIESDFHTLWNTIWLNFITMSTVGYGDYAPKTIFGKLFSIITCLMGNFLLSMLVAVLSIHVYFNSDELKAYRKLIEKEIIYNEMPLEIKEVFNIICEMFIEYMYFKKDDNNETNESEVKSLEKLLLRFKLKKLNEKKKIVLQEEGDSTEKLLEKFDRHLDLDFGECSNKTITIIKNEKKLFEIAKNQPTLAAKVFDSKDYANRIANLANLMRVIGTCGKIESIYDIEGGRLFNRKELVEYQRYFYYDTVLKNKNNELSKKEKKNSIAHSNSFLC
jgi:hypothetical protein